MQKHSNGWHAERFIDRWMVCNVVVAFGINPMPGNPARISAPVSWDRNPQEEEESDRRRRVASRTPSVAWTKPLPSAWEETIDLASCMLGAASSQGVHPRDLPRSDPPFPPRHLPQGQSPLDLCSCWRSWLIACGYVKSGGLAVQGAWTTPLLPAACPSPKALDLPLPPSQPTILQSPLSSAETGLESRERHKTEL